MVLFVTFPVQKVGLKEFRELFRGINMIKTIKCIMVTVCISSALMVGGCSSSPSEEEMKQLNDLKAQATALEKQVGDKTREKANLEKQIAEKNGKLQQCQSDQEAVKKAMGGQ